MKKENLLLDSMFLIRKFKNRTSLRVFQDKES